MGAVSQRGMQKAVDAALAEAGVAAEDLTGTVATGYGRRLVPGAGRTFTEITCHARGTAAMCPGVRLVIDIGGQDSKAITIDEERPGRGLRHERPVRQRHRPVLRGAGPRA